MLTEQEQIEIFAHCLRSIEQGRTTVDECVQRYPEMEGLREMLETERAARQLPSVSMSEARKQQLRQQLAARAKNSKVAGPRSAPGWRPVPVTFLATLVFMLIAGGVVVHAVWQRSILQGPAAPPSATSSVAATSTPSFHLTDTPYPATPTQQYTDTPSASDVQPTSTDDFAVTTTMQGIVKSVKLQSQGSYVVTLDDGSVIVVNANTDGAQNIAVGRAISVVVTIGDNNSLTAQTMSLADNPLGGPTPDTTLADIAANCGKNDDPPVAVSLAKTFKVQVSEIEGWFCKGYGYGEIARAYLLAKKSGKFSPDQIFAMRAAGEGWGQIIRNSCLSPKDLAPGSVISANKGQGKGNGAGNDKGDGNDNGSDNGNGNGGGNGNGNGHGNGRGNGKGKGNLQTTVTPFDDGNDNGNGYGCSVGNGKP